MFDAPGYVPPLIGDGSRPANDIQGWATGTADTSCQLRAERYEAERVYTLTYRAKDRAGNTKECQATVKAPKGWEQYTLAHPRSLLLGRA